MRRLRVGRLRELSEGEKSMSEKFHTTWALNNRLERKLRLGMVGGGLGGFIGALHRTSATIDGRWTVVAGALSRNADRARASAENWYLDPARSYGDYREMIRCEAARDDRPDAITIVTTNETHYEIAIACLEAGFNVLCDKPLSIRAEEARKLADLSEEKGAIFAVSYSYSGYPMIRHAKAMIERGDLGDIRSVIVEYASQYGTEPEYGMPWMDDPAKTGPSSLVAGTGTHAFHLAEFVAGVRVNELSADLATLVPGHRLEDHATMHLRFENGARGFLWNTSLAPGNENGLSLRIYGNKGGLRWNQEQPNVLHYAPLNAPTQTINRGGFGTDSAARRWERAVAGQPEGYLEALGNIYAEFAEALLAKEAGTHFDADKYLFPTVRDGARGIDFVYASLKSSAQNAAFVSL